MNAIEYDLAEGASSYDANMLANDVLQSSSIDLNQSLALLKSEEARNIVSSTLDGIKTITQSSVDLDLIKSLLPSSEINSALAQNGSTIASILILLISVYTIFQGIKNSVMIPITSLFGAFLTLFVWVNVTPFVENNNPFEWLRGIFVSIGAKNIPSDNPIMFASSIPDGIAIAAGWLSDGWSILVFFLMLTFAEYIYFAIAKVASNSYVVDGTIIALVSRVPLLAANTMITLKIISIWISLMTTFLISSAIFYLEFREGAWLQRYTNIDKQPLYDKMLEAGKWFYETVDIGGITSFF